jgi:hypothetical protein
VVGEDSDLGRKRCVRKDSCLKHTIEKVLPEVEKPGRFYFRLRKKISSFKKPSWFDSHSSIYSLLVFPKNERARCCVERRRSAAASPRK